MAFFIVMSAGMSRIARPFVASAGELETYSAVQIMHGPFSTRAFAEKRLSWTSAGLVDA